MTNQGCAKLPLRVEEIPFHCRTTHRTRFLAFFKVPWFDQCPLVLSEQLITSFSTRQLRGSAKNFLLKSMQMMTRGTFLLDSLIDCFSDFFAPCLIFLSFLWTFWFLWIFSDFFRWFFFVATPSEATSRSKAKKRTVTKRWVSSKLNWFSLFLKLKVCSWTQFLYLNETTIREVYFLFRPHFPVIHLNSTETCSNLINIACQARPLFYDKPS